MHLHTSLRFALGASVAHSSVLWIAMASLACAGSAARTSSGQRAGKAPALESVLRIENKRDARERAKAAAALAKLRVSLRLEDADPRAVAAQLRAHVGDVTTFFVRSKDGERDWDRVTLRLQGQTCLQAMSILSRVSKIRFVFRSGVVMLVHEDDVRPETYLRVYDLRMALHKIRDFPGREIGVPVGEGRIEDDDVGEERSISGLSGEKIEEMVRQMVLPKSWDGDASIEMANGLFFVRQTPKGHAEVVRFLRRLGARVGVVRSPRRARKPVEKAAPKRKKARDGIEPRKTTAPRKATKSGERRS